MGNKSFNKNLPKKCEYCVFGTKSNYTDEVFCVKRGITELHDSCRKYKYDPLKRTPNRQKPSDNYKPEDFLL